MTQWRGVGHLLVVTSITLHIKGVVGDAQELINLYAGMGSAVLNTSLTRKPASLLSVMVNWPSGSDVLSNEVVFATEGRLTILFRSGNRYPRGTCTAVSHPLVRRVPARKRAEDVAVAPEVSCFVM